jgi:hypothetical protein
MPRTWFSAARGLPLEWSRSVSGLGELGLQDAEVAVHEGDAGPRREIWSRKEPVTVLGALNSAAGSELRSRQASSFTLELTRVVQNAPRTPPNPQRGRTQMLALAGTGYGLIGILVIILLIVLIFYFLRRA